MHMSFFHVMLTHFTRFETLEQQTADAVIYVYTYLSFFFFFSFFKVTCIYVFVSLRAEI